MTAWALTPSPVGGDRFLRDLREALTIVKFGGPCICPSHESNHGDCPIHDEHGRVRREYANSQEASS